MEGWHLSDIWDEYGVHSRIEQLVIADAGDHAWVIIDIIQGEDGRWHSDPHVRDHYRIADTKRCVHKTRREAIDFHTESARQFFQTRLMQAESGCYAADQIKEDAETILAQINELMASKQFDLFA